MGLRHGESNHGENRQKKLQEEQDVSINYYFYQVGLSRKIVNYWKKSPPNYCLSNLNLHYHSFQCGKKEK